MFNDHLVFNGLHKWHAGHHAIYFTATNSEGFYTFAIERDVINAHFKSINTQFSAIFNFKNNPRWIQRVATLAFLTSSPNEDGVILITTDMINARIVGPTVKNTTPELTPQLPLIAGEANQAAALPIEM